MIGLSVLVTSSAASSLNLALPSVAAGTGATQSQMLWIVDAYTVLMAGLLLAAGALGDRFGRRSILLLGLSMFGLAALVASFVDSPITLIVCRAVMGCAGALVLPTTLSVVTTTLPPERRNTAVGTWTGLAGAGAVLGMLASALLLQFFAWNSIFVLTVILAVIAITGVTLVLPSTRAEDPPKLDLLGAALSLIAISAVVVAILEGPDRGWTDGLVLVLFAVGVIAFASLIWHELRCDEPMIDPRVFRFRGVEVGTVSNFLVTMGSLGFMFMFTQYLQFVGGFSPIQVVCSVLPFALVMIPASRLTPRLAEKYGARTVMCGGFVLTAAAFVIGQFLGTDVDVLLVVLMMVIVGIGMACVSPVATTAIVTSLPEEKQGVASALGQTARSVAGSLGVALIGALLNSGYTSSLSEVIPANAPAEPARAAEASIAAADAIADQIGPQGEALSSAASQAFVDGLGHAFWGAVAIALAGLLYAAVRAPRRGSRSTEFLEP
ncbi:major facilitator superfamily MFS_1 [Gordonia neofelifaecis NRRL B-59395]|uniref:Major facilitator superfamily MFS_1 n=1 Tax=Gordonia neofelifaecis NRRL B-59395 TaxID=644548 RepID=F1YGW9_9ACTN|nr:major facilitator superfamily MFS_1 [Gordonia neofelifaecis NRRL B-59395]